MTRTIAITGAAHGIGAEAARLFKAEGATVHAFDIDEPAAHVDGWTRVDMSDPASIDAALAEADGRYDALCNIAGLPPREGLEAAILRVNFFGLRRFAEGMLGTLNQGASIVSLASRAGQKWRQNLDQVKAFMALDETKLEDFIAAEGVDPVRAYDLSKESVVVWTMANVERLHGMGLRANSVSPAAIETRILKDFVGAFGERATKGIARTGRAGTAAEAAEVVNWLASPRSGWVNGQDISVDGGLFTMMAADELGLSN